MPRGRIGRKISAGAGIVGIALVGSLLPAGAGNGAFVEVTKVAGPNTPADATFVISVACEGSPDVIVDFDAAGGTELVPVDSLLEGTCTFTETTTAGGTPSYACESADEAFAICTSTDGPSPAVLEVNDPGFQEDPIATITVTNTFDPPTPPAPTPESVAIEAAPTFTG